jgi:hypothetical protein
MRNLLIFLFLFISTLGFGQQLNAPDPKEFTVNTSGQDASGFSLSGFNSTSTLLCAIGLPVAPNGTTFYMTTTAGLTPASGYTMSGNKTRLAFTGTMANINNALATLKINTTATAGNIQISVSATINPTGYFYNPTNGHFYRPISTGANFTNAITLSSQQTFKGQTGYLVTITSADEDAFIFNNVPQSNIWFAADDRTTEARWVISNGPEINTLLRIGNASGTNQQGVYNNWAPGEPNDWGMNEDAAVTKWGGGNQWNDLSTANVNPYVVEFGTWTNPDDQTFTEFYNNSVIHSNGVNTSLRANFSFNFGGNIDETKFLGALFKRNDTNSQWTGNTFKSLNGLGRVTLSEQLDTAKIYSSGISIATANDMTQYSETDIGKIYKMTITGNTGGTIWGTNIYTNDSYIPKAAVHAGVVTAGQTKEVYIKIVEGLNDYPASTQNGVTSDAWGAWGLSYQFVNEPSSYKANTSGGQVEWCVIYDYDASNQRYRVGIDKREFNGTNVSSTAVSRLKLFDLWDGVVTFKSDDGTWAEYWIYTPTQFNYTGSSFSSFLRQGNGFYGVSAEFTFAQLGNYKQHKFQFQNYDSVQLKTLYNSIVTISDVYMAFKEQANNGIFGNQSGNEFAYGIQYKNADVNDDGIFNEADCFALLQNLTGAKNLVSSYTLDNTIKIVLDSTYALIGKSNWQQFPSFNGKDYGFSLLDNKINYNYNLAVTWKGDVNLSHSATPPSNGITTMSANFGERSMSVNGEPTAYIISQIVGDSLIATIKFNPNINSIVGTQFQINYDNSLITLSSTKYKTTGSPINFANDRGTFINLGSLNTGGELLDGTTEYQLTFKLKQQLDNSLGLVSIAGNEAVNKDGKTIKIKIQ